MTGFYVFAGASVGFCFGWMIAASIGYRKGAAAQLHADKAVLCDAGVLLAEAHIERDRARALLAKELRKDVIA